MENYRRESALKMARRNATYSVETLKTSLKDFDIQWGLGNRLHRSDQRGEVSSTKEQLSMKKKASVKRWVKLAETAEVAESAGRSSRNSRISCYC